MTTISDALAAYRIFAQAKGKSPKTVRWTESSVGYFVVFIGGQQQDISKITGDDLRRFIIALKERRKFASHPFTLPMESTISLQSIQTYARAVRAFFEATLPLHKIGMYVNPYSSLSISVSECRCSSPCRIRFICASANNPNKS